MSNALARPDAQAKDLMREVSRSLESNKATIMALLPKEITHEKLKALTLTSIRKSPGLLKCSSSSIMACVYEACKLGLQPDTATADCHIIPRKGEATFQIGFKGLMKLLRRAAPMTTIKAEHVREGDHFVWCEGLDPKLEHTRAKAGKRAEQPILYAYAIARFANGRTEFKVVDADDIARAKKSAHITGFSPWTHHEGAMWEKTAIKRLCKTLPVDDPSGNHSAHLYRAIELDDAAEDDRAQDLSLPAPADAEEVIDVGETAEAWHCPACNTPDEREHAKGCPEGPAA